MAETIGLVVGTSHNGRAEVVTERREACAGCAMADSCPAPCSRIRIVTTVLNKAEAKEGDMVSVHLDSPMVLKSAAILYLIPVFTLMAGAFAGMALAGGLAIDQTNIAIFFSVIGICFGFCLTVLISKRMSRKNRLTPIIAGIIEPDATKLKHWCHSKSS